MTLDEMIAWLEQQACDYLWCFTRQDREHAATLLTIENALRAVRDGVTA